MYKDLTLINGPDHPAFVLRFLICGLFAVMAMEAISSRNAAV